MAAAARQTQRVGGTLAYVVNPSLPIDAAEQARAAADGLVLGTYDTRKWLSEERDDRKPFERLVIVGGDNGSTEAAERAARVAEWANRARDLSNAPPNELTPDGSLSAPPSSLPKACTSKRSTASRSSSSEWARSQASRKARTTSRASIIMRYEPADAKSDITLGSSARRSRSTPAASRSSRR